MHIKVLPSPSLKQPKTSSQMQYIYFSSLIGHAHMLIKSMAFIIHICITQFHDLYQISNMQNMLELPIYIPAPHCTCYRFSYNQNINLKLDMQQVVSSYTNIPKFQINQTTARYITRMTKIGKTHFPAQTDMQKSSLWPNLEPQPNHEYNSDCPKIRSI